jgi:hypothetical protein
LHFRVLSFFTLATALICAATMAVSTSSLSGQNQGYLLELGDQPKMDMAFDRIMGGRRFNLVEKFDFKSGSIPDVNRCFSTRDDRPNNFGCDRSVTDFHRCLWPTISMASLCLPRLSTSAWR